MAFSGVLSLAAHRRRFDELTLTRVAALGAVGGVFVSLVPAALIAGGLGTPSVPVVALTLSLMGPFAIGGAIAAAGSLALARVSDDRDLLESGREVADVGLSSEEERELLG